MSLLSNLLTARHHFSIPVFQSPDSTKYIGLTLYGGKKKGKRIIESHQYFIFFLTLHAFPVAFTTG